MLKYSFIIPVYKAEKYLYECVESVLSQSFKDVEIVLVDDGSPDNSGIICDELSQKYSNIRVIHKENGGASSARNAGLKICQGEYVVFLDSDDFWGDNEALKKIDNLFENGVDIVAFASKDLYDDGTFVEDRYNYPEEMNSLTPLDTLKYMVSHDALNMHTAKRVYKKSFLINNGLFFKEGIRSEDVELGMRYSNLLPTYRFLNEKIYVYRHHEDSVTTTIGEKHLEEYLGIIEEFADYEYASEEIKECLYSYLAYQYSLLLAFITYLKPKNRKILLKKLKRYTYLWDYTMYPRTKMISKFYKVFGFTITRLFLGWYLGKRR